MASPILLLLLLPSLGASYSLGRDLSRPLEDTEPYLHPVDSETQASGLLWWSRTHFDSLQGPAAVAQRPADSTLGPALPGPHAAPGALGVQLPMRDNLQLAQRPSSQGWMGPPDTQGPWEQDTFAPLPAGASHLTVTPIPPSLQVRPATLPPAPQEPQGPARQHPSRDRDPKAKSKTRAPPASPLDPQGPHHTLMPHTGAVRERVLGGQAGHEGDFKEAAQGLQVTQDSVAPSADSSSPADPSIQPDLALARRLPPAEELPPEPREKTSAGDTWDISSLGPWPKQMDLPDVEGSQELQPTHTAASEALDGQLKPAMNGADPISPQRVRGAVGAPDTSKSLVPSTSDPGLAINGTESPLRGLQPDKAEEWPGWPQSHPPAPPVQAPSTSRRGLIRVTTQRALGQPLPPEPSASSTASAPVSSPPANATAPPLRWGPLRQVLSFSWELHVYGVGVLFLLPALLALATLAAALAGPRLALVATALVLLASGLRSAYMLTDPYGSQARLGERTGLVLYNLPFPLLLTALAALTLLGLGAGLPPMLQKPPLLGSLALVHGAGLLAADLLSARPVLNLLVQGLSCAWGASVALGTLCLCRRRLLDAPRGWDPSPGPRLLAVAGSLGLLASGLQLAASLWLYPGPGRVGRFSWAWWGVHFWLRLLELTWALALALSAMAAARPWPPTEHACWAKLLRLACPVPPSKSEVPERPNNCYAGPSGLGQAGLDISKSLIRNSGEGGPPATPSSGAWGSAASLGRAAPGGPGRSCSSMGPAPSLSELDLRPPSPINLSRSIDAALFREHLVRDSVFRRCGLQNLTSQPPGGALRVRRGSQHDAEPNTGCTLLRTRCRSFSDVGGQGPKGAADQAASGSSLDSFSRGSLKISWNPWQHGLSSVDSLPLEELPSTVQLLPAPAPAPAPARQGESQPEVPPGSKAGNSHSASSDTIEL
uniref:Proline rich transmembrane protein 3 n=1 Tax=Cavia porcellus TaxID=10141 RepID=H0V8W6_CAVPO